jgi:hypothetical protein
MTGAWPAESSMLAGATAFLQGCVGRVVIACHSDVDGLAAAVMVAKALRPHAADVSIVPSRRGEHVHTPAMQARIAAYHPDHLIVTDMGMRPGRIAAVPTLVIDHHAPVSGTTRPPRTPSTPTAIRARRVAACLLPSSTDSSRRCASPLRRADRRASVQGATLLRTRRAA